MPDDRPESPEERLREAVAKIVHAARVEYLGFPPDPHIEEATALLVAALSTPAGPSPERAGIYDAEPAEPSIAKCDRPPAGWNCSREPGHDGPCAARSDHEQNLIVGTFNAIQEQERLRSVLGTTVREIDRARGLISPGMRAGTSEARAVLDRAAERARSAISPESPEGQ